MRMKLVRDNDDPKLLADLDRLAGREPIAASEHAAEAASAEPLDDPFVRRFVQVSVHLKRYLPFYIGAAVWALTMLLIHPLGKGNESNFASGTSGLAGQSVPVATASASSPAPSAVADLGADAIAAPTFEAVTAATFGSESTSSFDEAASSSSSASPESSASSSDFSSTNTTLAFSSDFGSDTPKQHAIVRSGYASSTGGTPLEQQPANGGLPVASTAGQDSKRSFIELSGEGSQLRLKVSADGAIQADTAVIKVCVLTTSDWKADRGQPMPGPAFDPACSTGSVLDGIWTFDLSSFSKEDLARGLALTPGAGTGLTFQVVFEPVAQPTENA
jgi:hypothetical protein